MYFPSPQMNSEMVSLNVAHAVDSIEYECLLFNWAFNVFLILEIKFSASEGILIYEFGMWLGQVSNLIRIYKNTNLRRKIFQQSKSDASGHTYVINTNGW